MPSPSTSLSTLRPELAGSLEQFDLAMDRQGFIGRRVLPTFPVAVQSGDFGKIPVAQLLQARTTDRAPGGGYSRGQFTFTKDSFATKEHGAEEPIDDREADMYAAYFDAEVVSSQRAMDAVLRNAEIRVASAIFNTTTWTGASLTTAVGTPWSTIATATPITDIEGAVRKVWDNSGIWPNALIVDKLVFRNLRRCDQVISRIESNGAGGPARAGDVTVEQLAQVFDLRFVIVAGSGKNTAAEGQSATFGKIWSTANAMVCRVAESNDIREPCIGRTFYWPGDGGDVDGTIETYRDETVRSNIVRVRHDVHEKVLYTEMGHLLTNIT